MHFLSRAAQAVLLVSVAAAGLSGQTPSIAGRWEGTVQMPEREGRVAVDLAKNDKGEWIGDFDVLDQENVKDLPVLKIRQDGVAFSFAVSLPGEPVFEGKMSEDGKSLAGNVTMGGRTLPFELKRTGEAKVVLPPPPAPLAKEFEGTWEGSLDTPGGTLRIVVILVRAADGTGTGTLESPDQNSPRMPLNAISQQGKSLEFALKVVNGGYKGKLNEAGTELTGEWTQNDNSLPLVLKKK